MQNQERSILQNDQFFTKGVKIFRKHVFQLSWKVCIKVEKVLSLQRNDKKVILLLIYHISGFYGKYSQELSNK